MAAPHRAHGSDLKVMDLSSPAHALAQYVTARVRLRDGLALELTDAVGGKTARLSNRTPWQILADAMRSDIGSLVLWKEWEEGSKGKRALLWSTGIREAYGDVLTAALDLDAPDELEYELLGMEGELWSDLLQVGKPGELLAVVEAGFHSDPSDDLWGRLEAAQNAAIGYLLDRGLCWDSWYAPDLDVARQHAEWLATPTPEIPAVVEDSKKSDLPLWWSAPTLFEVEAPNRLLAFNRG
jgi:hypothetical protein